MERSQISGLVLVHGNRDPRLTLDSLAPVCEQVVVVDDTTAPSRIAWEEVDYPGELTIIERSFDTFPLQRNAGLEKVIGGWALVVDSDETLSRELQTEIRDIGDAECIDVYALPRVETLRGKHMHHATLHGPHPRLFRSDLRYSEEPVVHERLEGFGDLRKRTLDEPLIHHNTDTVSSLIAKSFSYGVLHGKSEFGAENQLPVRLIARFLLGDLIKRRYVRDGTEGVAIALANASASLGEKRGARIK